LPDLEVIERIDITEDIIVMGKGSSKKGES